MLAGATVCALAACLFTRAGWTLVMSALEPLRAFIYSSRLDSRLSVRPFCRIAMFYVAGGWSLALSGVGALFTGIER